MSSITAPRCFAFPDDVRKNRPIPHCVRPYPTPGFDSHTRPLTFRSIRLIQPTLGLEAQRFGHRHTLIGLNAAPELQLYGLECNNLSSPLWVRDSESPDS